VPRTTASASRGRRHVRATVTGAAVLTSLFLGATAARAAMTPGTATPLVTWSNGGTDQAAPAEAVPTANTTSDTASASEDGSLSQTIGVSVLPGPLTVAPATETVSLSATRVLGRRVYIGQLAPITVVDARGSLVGWRAGVSLQSVSGADNAALAGAVLCLTPQRPTMVAGNPADIVRGARSSCTHGGQTASVFWAAPGGGGGTYSDTASVLLSLPGGGTLPSGATASVAVSVD
jgi:hypothetical protein